MTADLILAVDQGTTNTKACLVDAPGRVVASRVGAGAGRVPAARLGRERRGGAVADRGAGDRRAWPGVDGAAAWRPSRSPTSASRSWCGSARPAARWGRCVSWQCRRSTELCEAIRAGGDEALVRARTGLALDPMFSASKARWLLDHIDGRRTDGPSAASCASAPWTPGSPGTCRAARRS